MWTRGSLRGGAATFIASQGAKNFARPWNSASTHAAAAARIARRFHGDMAEAAANATGVWGAYLRTCAKYPVGSAIGTSAVLWAIGDAVAQRIEALEAARSTPSAHATKSSQEEKGHGGHNGKAPGFDGVRWGATVFEGSLVAGGLGLFWYAFLDRTVSRFAHAGTLKFVGMKLAMEFFIWHPITLLTFWSFLGKVEGQTNAQIKGELKTQFVPTLLSEYVLWAPIDILNFWLVPVHLQVLCVNLGCLLEAVVLSYIHSHGFPSFSKDEHAAAAPVLVADVTGIERLPTSRNGEVVLTNKSLEPAAPFAARKACLLPTGVEKFFTSGSRSLELRQASAEWDRVDTKKEGRLDASRLAELIQLGSLPGLPPGAVANVAGQLLLRKATKQQVSTTSNQDGAAGFVTKAEYISFLAKLHDVNYRFKFLDQVVFSLFDTNGDGSIDRREAADFLRVMFGAEHATADADALFKRFDTNNDGTLSLQEVRQALSDARKAPR